MKKTIKLFAIMCVLSLLVAAIGEIPISAAEDGKEEKIVRVVTQKQLNKALKDSEIDTIIFRTDSFDFFNITSKKAKKKDLIIDAPNAFVFNYSKFKSIDIENVSNYFENVSGNTITLSGNGVIAVGKDAIIKEAIFKVIDPQCIVQTGGLIKKITFEHNGNKGTYDSSSDRIIYLETEMYNYETESDDKLSCTYIFDDSGNLIEKKYKKNDSWEDYTFFSFIYDKNGIPIREAVFELYDGEPSFNCCYRENDDFGNVLSVEYFNGDLYQYEYREDSPYQESKVHFENETSISDTENFYDENNRLVKEIKTHCDIVDGVKGPEQKDEKIFKYYSNGSPKTYDYYYCDGSEIHKTFIFDKWWNLVHVKRETYDPETGLTSVYEEKYEYDEYGNITKMFCKYPEDDKWVDPAEYVG